MHVDFKTMLLSTYIYTKKIQKSKFYLNKR